MLTSIRKTLGRQWKHVGLRLGLHITTLENIQLNNINQVEEQAFEMLKAWCDSDTESCYCKLISVLIAEDLNNVAEELTKIIKNQ